MLVVKYHLKKCSAISDNDVLVTFIPPINCILCLLHTPERYLWSKMRSLIIDLSVERALARREVHLDLWLVISWICVFPVSTFDYLELIYIFLCAKTTVVTGYGSIINIILKLYIFICLELFCVLKFVPIMLKLF